jgi:hypothetical protein
MKRELTSELGNINSFTGIIKALDACNIHLMEHPDSSFGFPSWSWAGWRMNRGVGGGVLHLWS